MDNSKKTRILFIYGPLGGGGAERVLLEILSQLDSSKYEIDLCLFVNGGVLLPLVPSYVNTFYIWPDYTWSYKLIYRLSIWFRSNSLMRWMANKKINKQYDVTISFLEGLPLKIHALLKTSSRKISWVHIDLFNFPYERSQFYKGEELQAYNQMDEIICVSEDARKAFLKRFENVLPKCSVIYNPIPIKDIQEKANAFQISKSRFTSVVVGRLGEQKRIDRVIRLARRCKDNYLDVQFTIVGEGPHKKDLEKMAMDLGVEDRIVFTGFQPNPYPYIKNADLLLSTSGFEGFGLVICEAMALGVPVISTRTAGPSEIIEDNKYGLLCDHDDESIYNAFFKMYSSPELRQHYIETGKERVKIFGVDNIMKQIEGVLDGVK